MKSREITKSRKIVAIVSLLGMIAIGIITRFVDGGILGETHIYNIMGGQNRNEVLLQIARIFAFIGSPLFLVPTVPIAFFGALYFNRRILALGLSISALGSFIFNQITKSIFRRGRPIGYMLMNESSFSYPSGHTMTNTCIYLFLAYYFSQGKSSKEKRLYFGIATLFSLIMGLSRIHLGVHYITDVLGGFLSAYFFNYVTTELIKKSKYTL